MEGLKHRWIMSICLLLVASFLLQITPYFTMNKFESLVFNGIVFMVVVFFSVKASTRQYRVINPPQRMPSGEYIPTTSPPADAKVTQRMRLGEITDPESAAGTPLFVSDSDFKRHMVIVGQSGTGKTVCIENLLWQQIRRGGGAVFVDGKLDGETLVKMKKLMLAAGRLDELLVLNPDDWERSHTYNPLLTGDVESVVNRIMSTYGEGGSGASEHFTTMNKAGLSVVIAAIHKLELAFSFEDLSIIMSSPTAFFELWTMLPRSSEKTTMATYMESMMSRDMRGRKEIDLKKFKENLGGLASRMSMLSQGGIGEIFNSYSPQIKLYDVIVRNKILYVMLPSMEKSETTAKYIGQFIISDLQSAIAKVNKLREHEKPATPFMLLFDEFGAYATYSSRLLWEQARSAGICCCAAFQTFSSLERLGVDFRNMIMGNSMVKIFYALRDQDSPEQASKLLGYKEEAKSFVGEQLEDDGTTEVSDAKENFIKDNKRISVRMGSYQKVGPNVFKNLGLGEAIVSVTNDIYKIKGPQVFGYDKISPNKDIELSYSREVGATGLNFVKVWQRLLEKELDFDKVKSMLDEESDYED